MRNDLIMLAHGGGGSLTAELLESVILPALGGRPSRGLTDSAILTAPQGSIAMTTDSYVVWPLEFPGGDIGKLAVCGTVNDLSVAGSVPLALSLGLILEEGLELSLLRRVLASIGRTAAQVGVRVVTGDTKVVERGGVAGMILNTSGIGSVLPGAALGFEQVREGDRVVLSGPLGEHGVAVMGCRKGLGFTAELVSDCAPLHELTRALVEELSGAIRFMRDPTRGGLAASLVEIAQESGRDILAYEESIPVNRTARAAAEMLGLDLLNVANEGKLLAVVAPEASGKAVEILRRFDISKHASEIGTIGASSDEPLVELQTAIGGRRIIQMPYGEELPRIC